ncbi:LacI family DNA-binding transcriptional regulator [Phytoactinopolyspora halophila]|uniref:LacI family DNA-binding transcriptional regulator n=1 Tax=Phytoactinopolyspora halophila TaxID=1981511 RepID=UPI000F4E354A|nr:LacI family DNA-binding transcriptional regulator [Phytoactinopolyspora halophila]
MPESRATLADIAERAGVSLAAASLAVRGKPGVGDTTRQRVLDIAHELDYRARSSTSSPGAIGVLVRARERDHIESDAFYGSVIAGITEECATIDADLRLDSLTVDDQLNPVSTPRLVEAPHIRGFLVLGTFVSAETIRLLSRWPVVLVDSYTAEPGMFPGVVSDNMGGTAAATSRLIGLGHRRIALVGTNPAAFPSILERRDGYTRTMLAEGLEPWYIDGQHHTPGPCVAAAVQALDQEPPPTAFVTANDAVALELMGELRDRVPRQVSIIGFDDIEAASLMRPRLDTVAVDTRAMGRLAVSMLRHRLTHPDDAVFTAVQGASLVVRDTTAPPP